MNKIKIITDSTADLTRELYDRYDISVVPLQIICDDVSYTDGEVTQEEIFSWADRTGRTPKTAVSGLELSVSAIKPHLDKGAEIIFFGISETMSASCNLMRIAAKELECEDRVHVINSQNLSCGIGLLIAAAAELAGGGMPAREIAGVVEGLRDKVRASFVIETLTYLHRGGRCSALTAIIANQFNLKPKIILSGGKMSVGKRYRGSLDAVVRKYTEDLLPEMKNADTRRIFVVDTFLPDYIYLRDEVVRHIEWLGIFDEICVCKAGGVISSHCGPNTLGIMLLQKQ
ncbi:MAG: DegV family EDD domain-containing protein [Oscillospiraceae bacterium]|nr:DegV family EDD domain-containing protein [Oscillospiraceae bacterium]